MHCSNYTTEQLGKTVGLICGGGHEPQAESKREQFRKLTMAETQKQITAFITMMLQKLKPLAQGGGIPAKAFNMALAGHPQFGIVSSTVHANVDCPPNTLALITSGYCESGEQPARRVVSAAQSMQQTWTVLPHDGPLINLGLLSIRWRHSVLAEAAADGEPSSVVGVSDYLKGLRIDKIRPIIEKCRRSLPPVHGLSYRVMALTTSGCNQTGTAASIGWARTSSSSWPRL